ncbi:MULTISPECIES: alpha-E domain-containing protein [Lysinibacillus]|uniref:alpha-E domain-containing protein n=1 Tax=Lysinibacillus TaxID=400634 RepID=UPI0021A886E8|nr:alpha-E domain-containing protein [Lysinibacillus capsici]MCT1538599.1 alpha-E domain-containing protein [Lysinibacillus capsici]MCT1569307.1 alpha-E domain-containing protein [Lysinibacillus capsici]MCT1646322.1 alpha-E domain-containing protein [Lysinibacillus capsici]MCT1725172.1 alpha-E domain-containing protein [Lysinibacillus capsici]MCT1784784.1 alpha-E domain-containing protein [Lysinibacillus capsici]
MLSRVADALYWMARYSERTQTNAHILQVQLLNMLEQSGQEHDYIDHWEAVLNICASKEEYLANYTTIRVNPLIDYLLFSEKNGNALHATLRANRENARVTRDSMPTELWEIQNSFYLTKQQSILKRERPIPLIALQDFLQDVRKTLWMETGLIEGSMDRDLPFYFMQVGKWLERAEKTIRMIVIIVEQQKRTGTSLLEDDGIFLLDLSAARESFMRKHRQTNLLTVIRYLVQDAHFPCSVMFCVKKIEEAITAIEHDSLSPRFLTLQSDISSLVLAIDHIDFWQMTIEETLKMMEERLSQCMAFSDAFSTIYHLYEPSVQP